MRRLVLPEIERARVRHGDFGSDPSYGLNGCFVFRRKSIVLQVLVSDGEPPIAEGWEHVSVSTKRRCPTWEEMCYIKDLFWGDHETVIQFHPARGDYISQHPYCLHLWRQKNGQSTPPLVLIGTETKETSGVAEGDH